MEHMKVAFLLFVVIFVSLATGLPKILVAQEAQPNHLFKHLDGWADVSIAQGDWLQSAKEDNEIVAVVLDGSIFAKDPTKVHSFLLQYSKPIIIVNMKEGHKEMLNEKMSFGTTGASYIYALLPFTDSNHLTHHRVIDVPSRSVFASQGKGHARMEVATNFAESSRLFSDEMFACVVNGVFDPPANMTPPQGALYAILPTTIIGSYEANLADDGKPGTQIFSHRLDNNYYNYRENGFGEDGYYTVLMQDGLVNPGTLIVNDPSQAIGFFQYFFAVNNQPLPNGNSPNPSTYYWAQSSPSTVDQTISVTESVTESVSLEIDMTVDGPSSKISVSWTASTSTTSEISQWGVVEDTSPLNSSTAWTFHQQTPYDPSELQWGNFGSWWGQAYNGNNVNVVPDLSTNTLQIHTISAWYAAGSLRNTDGTLPIVTTTARNHDVSIVANPGYLNSHHRAEWWIYEVADSYKMDLNSFPNSTSTHL